MDNAELTPLHSVVKDNNLEAIELLLKEGMDIYCKNEKGYTPLDLLILERLKMLESEYKMIIIDRNSKTIKNIGINEKLIDVLLKYSSTHPTDDNDMRLLNFHAACTLKNCAIMEKFLEKFGEINQSVSVKRSIWQGNTGLHFAVLSYNIETIKILISKGANMLVHNAKGLSPLDICLKYFKIKDKISIVTFVPAWKDILFSDGKTKLMDCVSSLQSSDSVKKFLQQFKEATQISVQKKSPLWPGYTIIHLAVTFIPDTRNKTVLNDILDIGGDITVPDIHGTTPVHLAFRLNKKKLLHPLLNTHHDKIRNPVDKDNLSHLHIACFMNYLNLVKEFINLEANVDIVYNGNSYGSLRKGWTPLFTACLSDHSVAAKMLLEAGANLLHTDAEGFTPIHRLFNSNGKKNPVIEVLTAPKLFKDCTVEGAGLTHLHVMASWDKTTVIERLLDEGADIEASIGRTQVKDLQDFEGCRCLHLAVMNNHPASIQLLLDRGADIFAQKSNGMSPLFEVLSGKYNESLLKLFLSHLWKDKKLQTRMKTKTGLSMLHVACRALDYEKVGELVGKTVNAKTPNDCPIWPGYTALHVLTSFSLGIEGKDLQKRVDDLLSLLLSKKANVTLADANGDTPVHLALKCRYEDQGITRASMLIKHHRDFKVNPISKEGLSHFHIACLVCNPTVVSGLLKRGADVNHPTNDQHTRKYPLHLALNARAKHLIGAEFQLETIDLLVENGANVHTPDARGWTPLHYVAKCGPMRLLLLDKIVRDDTDMNREAIDGKTPFEILIQAGTCIKEIKYFIKRGCRVNSYNRIDNKGYMAMIFTQRRYSNLFPSILCLMISLPDIAEVDERGRNAIYNAISSDRIFLEENGLTFVIEELIKKGCSILQHDLSGKTPLHEAAESCEIEAVGALLMCGADINAVDSAGLSPFSYCVSPTGPNETGCDRYRKRNFLIEHLRKMHLVGLEISQLNNRLLTETVKNIAYYSQKVTMDAEVLQRIKMKIGNRGLELRDFIFENDVAKIISTFTSAERELVSSFLESIDYDSFGSFKYLIKLQYRKVLERLSLIKPAAESLNMLLEFPLPDLCVEIILKFLTNAELKTLVSTANTAMDVDR